MKRKDFLLIYEHKNRELNCLCLLRAELERRGYSVEIFCRFDLVKRIRILFSPKPKVVGCIAAYRTSSLFAQVYKYTGLVNKIINFRWEQVFSDSDIEKHTPSGEAKKIAHLCWGELPYRQLQEAGVEKLSITGPLQMDFAIPPLSGSFLNQVQIKERYGIPSYSKIFLYISSFAYATMSESELEYNEKWYGRSLRNLVDTEKKTFEYTLDCLKKLVEEDPSVYVVYRPHPGEDSSIVKTMDFPDRFIVNSDFSVLQWILTADRIITCISTSICEAFFARKSVVLLRPNPVHELLEPVIYKNCKFVKDYESLKLALYGPPSFPLDEKLIEEYYDVDVKKPSFLRTADFYEEVYNNDKFDYVQSKSYKFQILRNAISISLIYLIAKNKYISNLINIWPFSRLEHEYNEYIHYKPNVVSDQDIKEKVEKYKKIIEEY